MNETATNNNTRDIIIYEEKSKKNYDSYEIFTKSGVQRIQFKLNGKPYMKKKIERKGFTITKEEIDLINSLDCDYHNFPESVSCPGY